MKSILFVFGTRPEIIKIAPLYEVLKRNTNFSVKMCSTSQHAFMLDQMLDVFHLKPDYELNIMKENQTLTHITSSVLNKIEEVMHNEHFDLVLVQGDTTTSFAAALAAFYLRIPIGHIEAGLRTNNLYLPWPEEINRQLTARLATLHFAPTNLNKENLIKENIPEENIFITGNTGIDTLMAFDHLVKSDFTLRNKIEKDLEQKGFKVSEKPLVLMTIHRREHIGEDIENIFQAISVLASRHSEMDFVFPVHLNPSVQEPAYRCLKQLSNIYLLKPVDYQTMVYLISRCYLILTDSGGLQEEGPALGKPVIIVRNETERPEGVIEGAAIIVGTQSKKIIEKVESFLFDKNQGVNVPRYIYGDGKASLRISEIINQFLK